MVFGEWIIHRINQETELRYMSNLTHYRRCEITGQGKLFTKSVRHGADFKVLDISASGVRIATQQPLELHDHLELQVELEGHLIGDSRRLAGKVTKRMEMGTHTEYAIRFTGLSHKEIVEMDEFLRFNCGLGSIHSITGDESDRSDHWMGTGEYFPGKAK